MSEAAGALADAARSARRAALFGRWAVDVPRHLSAAYAFELEARRLFLWLPVAFGTGAVLYFSADREPEAWLCTGLSFVFALFAALARGHRNLFVLLVGGAAIFGGMASASWRTRWVAAPVLDRIRVVEVEGYIEEMDFRREGARFILRVFATDGLDSDKTPARMRLTTRRTPDF
jgi:competence protein ComEC